MHEPTHDKNRFVRLGLLDDIEPELFANAIRMTEVNKHRIITVRTSFLSGRRLRSSRIPACFFSSVVMSMESQGIWQVVAISSATVLGGLSALTSSAISPTAELFNTDSIFFRKPGSFSWRPCAVPRMMQRPVALPSIAADRPPIIGDYSIRRDTSPQGGI